MLGITFLSEQLVGFGKGTSYGASDGKLQWTFPAKWSRKLTILGKTFVILSWITFLLDVFSKDANGQVVVVVGFFLACEDFGKMFDNSFSATAFFVFFVFVFFSGN